MISFLKTDELPDIPKVSAVMRHSATPPNVCLGKRGGKFSRFKIIFFLPISWSRSVVLRMSCVKKRTNASGS